MVEFRKLHSAAKKDKALAKVLEKLTELIEVEVSLLTYYPAMARAHLAPHICDDDDGWHVVIPAIGYYSEHGYPEDEAQQRLNLRLAELDW